MKKKNKLRIIIISGVVIILVSIILISNIYNQKIELKKQLNKTDIIVFSQDDEQNSASTDEEGITLEKAKDIVLESIENADILNSEYRSSSGKNYYIVTVNKGNNEILVYVDENTGEILHQVER